MLYIIYQLFIVPSHGIILRKKVLTVHWGWGVHTIRFRNNVLFCFREEGTGEKKDKEDRVFFLVPSLTLEGSARRQLLTAHARFIFELGHDLLI